jgi:hypothetical protein
MLRDDEKLKEDPKTLQIQIEGLREQLFQLNEVANTRTAAALRNPVHYCTNDLSVEERQAVTRNAALRQEKSQLEDAIASLQTGSQECMKKKNQILAAVKATEEARQDLKVAQQLRDQSAKHVSQLTARTKELADLQSQMHQAGSDQRHEQRLLSEQVKEAEKQLLQSHNRMVKINARVKGGVTSEEATKLQAVVASQEKLISQLTKEIKLSKREHDQNLIKAKPAMPEAIKECQALQDEVDELENVLKSRDAELKKSYNPANARRQSLTKPQA